MAAAFHAGLPRHGQILDQTGQMTPGDPCEQPMCPDRPIDHDRHTWITPLTSKNASPAITHQLV
ncbi:hypothetical protein ACWCOZ_35095, partial [Streptomyces sp. NPDC001840]